MGIDFDAVVTAAIKESVRDSIGVVKGYSGSIVVNDVTHTYTATVIELGSIGDVSQVQVNISLDNGTRFKKVFAIDRNPVDRLTADLSSQKFRNFSQTSERDLESSNKSYDPPPSI